MVFSKIDSRIDSKIDYGIDAKFDSKVNQEAITGCILGCAVGDALGLPYEGMSAQRIQKRMGNKPLEHRFLFGRGMISDDTEHTCMVAQCLVDSAGDVDKFSRSLAWRMRWWFLGLPAGIGLGTLRACLKLWLGFPAKYSGVNSAGNGPMMRSAIIGVYASSDAKKREALVKASTRLTHLDPRAEYAAQLIAVLAAELSRSELLTEQKLHSITTRWTKQDEELKTSITQVIESVNLKEDAMVFCKKQGMEKGVSGYCYATLKVALHIILRNQNDYKTAITESINCGGDTDTLAAIVGSVVGAGVGATNIPPPWLGGVKEWPRSVSWMNKLAGQVGATKAENNIKESLNKSIKVPYPYAMVRNGFFMVVVLLHGFRRLFPPY